jgi:hypothetical protein
MSKNIGTPRPPKEGAIKFQYGRHEGDYDYLVLYGDGVPRCDRALIMNHMCSKNISLDWSDGGKPVFDDSLVDELEKRGYDTKTLRFYIEKKL